jgi:hypothetical protein
MLTKDHLARKSHQNIESLLKSLVYLTEDEEPSVLFLCLVEKKIEKVHNLASILRSHKLKQLCWEKQHFLL